MFKSSLAQFEVNQDKVKNNFAFSFMEGALVKAVKKGYWVLLDEINLASAETLEVIMAYLYAANSSNKHLEFKWTARRWFHMFN